jgi:hypothetical protein
MHRSLASIPRWGCFFWTGDNDDLRFSDWNDPNMLKKIQAVVSHGFGLLP